MECWLASSGAGLRRPGMAGDGKHAPSSENLPELPLHCMSGREQCPWRFLPQNQLMFSQPDVVGGIWLPVIKLKEFQWACKFESKENSNQLWRTNVDRHSFFIMSTACGCGAPWFGMICKESSSSRGTRRDCVPGIPPHLQLESRISHYGVAKATGFTQRQFSLCAGVQLCPSCQLLLRKEKSFSSVCKTQAQSWKPILLNGML